MKILNLAMLAVLLIFGTAVADEEVEKRMEFKIVVADEGADGTTTVNWSTDNPGFDMHSMQVGDTETITDDDGQTVTITRNEEGFTMDVDGQTIDLPAMDDHGMHMAFMSADGADMDFDIEVMGDGPHMMRAHHPEGVTIISAEPLDDSIKESIKSVLVSAGRDDEVTFIDGSSEAEHVKIVKKRVEVKE